MDFFTYIILLLIGGCFGGLMAGLLGVGGGIILTPIQYYLLVAYGVDSNIAMPLSFGTSLAVIFVTMIRSTKKHYDNDLVVTTFLSYIMVLGFIGAIIGAFISTHVDVSIHSLLGLIGGLLCGLLGVGGGIIMIPILTIVLKYPTHKAIGTSSASIIATSLGGLIAYMVLGWNVPNLPAYSIGYVNLIQFVFLTITSTIVAGYAANISKKVDSKKLKIVHILLVLYIGLKMVGIV